jgi:hypothetical protein
LNVSSFKINQEENKMAKAFSVATWNVEHFGALDKKTKKPIKPIQPIIDFEIIGTAPILLLTYSVLCCKFLACHD